MLKTNTTKPCVHCNPHTPPGRSIIEPIMTMYRSEALRLASSRSDRTPMALQFECRMCGRRWSHRVDVEFRSTLTR